MMQRNLLAVALMTLTGVSAALAQTAGMMNFQGYIKDTAGVPVNGTVNMLFDVRSSTTSMVTFNVNGVAATAGVLTTKYGPVAPSHFDGTSRFLRVTVTPVSPPGSAFTLADVEIVTPPAIAEQINRPGSGVPSVTVNGSTGYVGIGTTTPTEMLHIDGGNRSVRIGEFGRIVSPTATAAGINAGSSVWSYIARWDTNSTSWQQTDNGGPNAIAINDTSIRFLTAPGGGPTTIGQWNETMRVASNGNVGIGTVSPQAMLDVVGTIRVGSGNLGPIELVNTNTFSDIYPTTADGTDVKGLRIGGGGDVLAVRGAFAEFFGNENSSAGALTLNAGQGGSILMRTSNTERVSINASGNVGIGITSPSEKLTVLGGRIYSSGLGPASGITFEHLALYQDTDNTLKLTSAGSYTVAILNQGNVGIGTATPSHKLCVNGSIAAIGGLQTCSDVRLKTNINSFAGALDTLAKLRAVRFDWRCDEFPDRNFDDKPQIGFIAQELLDVVPEVVQQGSDGYYSVDYGRLTPVLTAAMQEMHALVQKLETAGREKDAEIAALRATGTRQQAAMDDLAKRLERLEAANSVATANGEGK